MIDIMSIVIKYGSLAIVLIAIGVGYYYLKGFYLEQKQEEVKEIKDGDDYFITGQPLVGADYDNT
jgi:hypothetical protein